MMSQLAVVVLQHLLYSCNKMKKNKTWNKAKNKTFVCGYCDWCKKELLSDEGGWIINLERKYFCHNGKDELCFDKYINHKKENNYANGRKEEIQLHKSW